MTKTIKVLLSLVLIDFLALTGYVLYHYGLGFLDVVVSNSVTALITFDLLIALSMISVWMWRDARSRDINPWPYVVLTLCTGSAGPLLYFIKTWRSDARPATLTGVPARA